MSGRRSLLIVVAVIVGYVFLTHDWIGNGWVLIVQLVGAAIFAAVAVYIAKDWELFDIALLLAIIIVLGMTAGLPLTICGGIFLSWLAIVAVIAGAFVLGVYLLMHSNPQ